MLSKDFNILVLSIDSLFPMVATDCAPANDAINKANSLLIPDFKHKAITASIASPEPILSVAVRGISN